MKKTLTATLISLSIATLSYAEPLEVTALGQPKVNTDEFIVEQGNQAIYSNMKKDTDEIKLESDPLGLKTLQREMSLAKIKERFKKEREKLAEETTHLQRFPDNNK